MIVMTDFNFEFKLAIAKKKGLAYDERRGGRVMARKEFKAKLERFEGVGTWTYFDIPFDATKAFGGRGQIKVRGTVNGVPVQSSLMPHGDGSHFLVVNKSVRDTGKAKVGGIVRVSLESDGAPRVAEAPPDLEKALSKNREAKAGWDAFSYSHKKAYLNWIVGARKEETRIKRVKKAVAMLAEKKTLK